MTAEDRNHLASRHQTTISVVAAVLRDGRGSQLEIWRALDQVSEWRPSSVTAEDRNRTPEAARFTVIEWRPSSVTAEDRNTAPDDGKAVLIWVAAVLRDGRGSQHDTSNSGVATARWRPSSVTAEDRNGIAATVRGPSHMVAAVLRDGRGSQPSAWSTSM